MDSLGNEKTPSEVYNMPIIGRIKCVLDMQITDMKTNKTSHVIEKDVFDVIKIVNLENDKKLYLCNCWNEPGVIQQVHSNQVESFEKI